MMNSSLRSRAVSVAAIVLSASLGFLLTPACSLAQSSSYFSSPLQSHAVRDPILLEKIDCNRQQYIACVNYCIRHLYPFQQNKCKEYCKHFGCE